MIHFRVIKTVEQMNRAWSGSGEANTNFTGEFVMRARHERRHLFVAYLHVLDRVTRAIDCSNDSVNAIARITIDAANAPLVDSFHQKVTGGFTHDVVDLSLLIPWKSDGPERGRQVSLLNSPFVFVPIRSSRACSHIRIGSAHRIRFKLVCVMKACRARWLFQFFARSSLICRTARHCNEHGFVRITTHADGRFWRVVQSIAQRQSAIRGRRSRQGGKMFINTSGIAIVLTS